MAETVRAKNIGLRGVTVADTKISFIDGENGILIYRGYRIEDLAKNSSFLETAFLLLNGRLPGREELEAFSRQVVEARKLPDFLLESLKKWPRESHPMDVIQASVPILAMDDPDLKEETREASVRQAIHLIARIPALVAAWQRTRNGLETVPPDDRLSHAANFLWQLTGKKPDEEIARDLDVCLVLHADHTFNASTFACREVVSTRAHMYAAVSAGVGALSGSLHGGANAQVLRMLQGVEKEKDIGAWVKKQLDQGKRIMGMGHAVYKTSDPRGKILREMGERMGKKLGKEEIIRLSAQIEEAAVSEFEKRGLPTIKPNVDFFSAPVYHLMGIPGDLMTPVFAVSRIAGWCAHIIEEQFAEAQEKPALYRPQAEYVGNYCGLMGCTYEPPEERK
ncbi:MAG TPA: citrate synthase [Thermodesulfobacteriota bacterium]|nr:citrate synthase [Thermodesulfobacteriota bacterium]